MQNLQKKHPCQSLFFNKVADLNFIKKDTQAQVFFCEFYEFFKNPFFKEHLQVNASAYIFNINELLQSQLLKTC